MAFEYWRVQRICESSKTENTFLKDNRSKVSTLHFNCPPNNFGNTCLYDRDFNLCLSRYVPLRVLLEDIRHNLNERFFTAFSYLRVYSLPLTHPFFGRRYAKRRNDYC